MLAGVTVVDPATTWVDVTVTFEQDAAVHPGTQLHGATHLAEGCEVGPNSRLTDTRVDAGARVDNTVAYSSHVGPQASVGPYAYLRPGTRLGLKSKIGTFVEAKNASIGEGTKVPHLSYMGDATIGEFTDIGAAKRVRQRRRAGQAPHDDRLALPYRFGQHVCGSRHGRGRCLHRRRLGDHEGRAARFAGRGPWPAAEYRGLGGPEASGERGGEGGRGSLPRGGRRRLTGNRRVEHGVP
ncbi:Bifunctional protein GlmU [Streptomyces violaceorubidus]